MDEKILDGSVFDTSTLYKEFIQPLLKQIECICSHNHIPMFAAFAIKENEDGTEYKYTYLSPTSVSNELKDDRLSDFVRVMQGYQVVSPDRYEEFVAQDLTVGSERVEDLFSDFSGIL